MDDELSVHDLFCLTPKQLRYIRLRKVHNEKIHSHKRKSLSLFQSDYIQLQLEVSSLTSTRYLVQAVPSKKKKKKEGEGKERGGKEEKKKRDGKSLCGRKGKEENERWQKRGKEGEGEERRERERGTENGENDARGALPSPDAFPSAKLGNNMTPIKGRLGKNTNSTSRSPTKPKQNLQVDPRQRRSSLEVSSRASLIYTP